MTEKQLFIMDTIRALGYKPNARLKRDGRIILTVYKDGGSWDFYLFENGELEHRDPSELPQALRDLVTATTGGVIV